MNDILNEIDDMTETLAADDPAGSVIDLLIRCRQEIVYLRDETDWFATILDSLNTWAREAQCQEFLHLPKGRELADYVNRLHGAVNAYWHRREDRLNERIAALESQLKFSQVFAIKKDQPK